MTANSSLQRGSWHPYFMDVKAIIFLAPISVFDEKTEGEGSINRLEDSIKFWTTICKSKLLAKVMELFISCAANETYELLYTGRTYPLSQQVRYSCEEARTRCFNETVYLHLRRSRQ